MIQSDITTIIIKDKINNTTIKVEIPKEIMHKLYRIKEINQYEKLEDYHNYNAFKDAINDVMHKFYGSIECDYQDLIQLVEQGNLENNSNDAIALIDTLLAKGCTYKDAVDIMTEYYNKIGD